LESRWLISNHPLYNRALQKMGILDVEEQQPGKQETVPDTPVQLPTWTCISLPKNKRIGYSILMSKAKDLAEFAVDNPTFYRKFLGWMNRSLTDCKEALQGSALQGSETFSPSPPLVRKRRGEDLINASDFTQLSKSRKLKKKARKSIPLEAQSTNSQPKKKAKKYIPNSQAKIQESQSQSTNSQAKKPDTTTKTPKPPLRCSARRRD